MEADLNGKGFSASDERRILDALGRSLLKEFPNPERVGCPGAEVLKSIAAHEMPLSEAEKWLDHLGSCSPCYADFKQFQEVFQRQRRQRWLAVAAGILLAVGVIGWAVLHNWNENLIAQTAVLDLRGRSPARGAETNPAEPPLQVSHNVSHVKIFLPVGSSKGDYAIRILGPGERIMVATEGTAEDQQGTRFLALDVSLTSVSSGLYLLQLQKVGLGEWASYPLRVK